jgi:hypothetical protein
MRGVAERLVAQSPFPTIQPRASVPHFAIATTLLHRARSPQVYQPSLPPTYTYSTLIRHQHTNAQLFRITSTHHAHLPRNLLPPLPLPLHAHPHLPPARARPALPRDTGQARCLAHGDVVRVVRGVCAVGSTAEVEDGERGDLRM